MFREIGKAKEQLTEHWLIDRMERPNPMAKLSAYALKYQTFALYDLDGEVLWYAPRSGKGVKRGNPEHITIFRKHEATPVPYGGIGEFLGWELSIDGRREFADRDDVVHFTYFDPLAFRASFDPFKMQPRTPNRGRSPIDSKRLTITTDIAMARYNRDFFNRGIAPNYHFAYDGDLTTEEQDAYREKLTARIAGKNGEIVLTEKGWTVTNTGAAAQRDAQFSEGRAASKAEQLAGLAPPIVMGESDATYANADKQMLMFYEVIVDPALIHICSTIDVSLLADEEDLWCELATDDVDALQVAKRERLKSAADLAGRRVPWDVAARTVGLDLEQFEGSDIAFGSYTDIPVSDILSGNSKAEITTPAPANATLPPDQTNAPSDSAPRFIRVIDSSETAVRVVESATSDMKRAAASDETLSAILKIIRDDDAELQKIVRRFHVVALNEGAKQIGDLLKIDTLIGIDNPHVKAFLDTRANLITSVNKTTGDQILEAVKSGINAGETPENIATGIKRVFNTRKDVDADFIARQEVGSALNGGRFLQTKEEGADGYEWLSSRDGNVRETHAPGTGVDGEIVALGDQFSNGCRYPQDPEGEKKEVLGCRCIGMPASVGGERMLRSEKQRDACWRANVAVAMKSTERKCASALGRLFNDQRGRVLAAVAKMLAA
jgi:phage portal protein BeeE